jgi:adenylate kinase
LALQKEIFVFLGPPGAGKGSLASMCVREHGWEKLSTGDLCRKNIAEQTEIGKKIDFAIKSGKLISDELITLMVEDWLGCKVEGHQAIILDGYPRTIAQAQEFTKLLSDKFDFLKLQVIRLAISDSLVIDRLSSRYVCQNKECQAVYSLVNGSNLAPKNHMQCNHCQSDIGRRDDDNEGVIRKRLKTYYTHEQEILNFYNQLGCSVKEVNVEKSLDAVFNDFKLLVGIENI